MGRKRRVVMPQDVPEKGAGRSTGKQRLMTLADLDRRTKAAQTARNTRDAIVADLGGADRLSTLELIQAENAAVTATLLRDQHVRWLRGEKIVIAELVSLENTFNRTAGALGVARRPKDVITLEGYLKASQGLVEAPEEGTKSEQATGPSGALESPEDAS
jgi:hypothetical protein